MHPIYGALDVRTMVIHPIYGALDFFKHDDIVVAFTSFGYPTYLIYPYGIIKLVGIVVLWLPGLNSLKEWAYSGFFFAFFKGWLFSLILLAAFPVMMILFGLMGKALQSGFVKNLKSYG